MLGDDWVAPFWLEQDAGLRSWTTVGNVGSRAQAIVDPRGLVAPRSPNTPHGWSMDWWIGAEDRWHVPSRETAVRQKLVANAPVVETAMRVPGGDVVHRAYAVSGDPELVVVEVENQTPTPVALAFAIRPYHLTLLGRIRRLRLEGATVSVEGRPVVFLPRPAARVAASSLADGDSARRVFDGTDDAGADFDIACDGGGAQAAFVYPLAHGATFRAAILLSGDAPSGVVGGRIAALPGSTEVARGWAAQTRRGMRLELPSGALADAVEANRRFLLLLSQGAGSRSDLAPLRRALAAYGFDREADELPKARGHLLPRWLRPGRTSPIDPADALERVQHMLTTASPTWTWPEGHDAHAAAELLLLVRDVLVREVDGGVALLPRLPDVWRGQPFEVHDAPIAGGKVSYAVRWHGDLPALLWELDAPRAVRLTAPGLDPAWSTTEPAGETLLAAPVPR